MNLTCYIVDDEFHSIEILKAFVEKTPGLELIGYSSDPLYALNQVANTNPPDLTFLDVDMPEMSGMEFAVHVNRHTKVIITTSFPEFAIEAFEKEAFDYLLKPIGYQRFLKTIMKLKRDLMEKVVQHAPRQFFFIQSNVKGRMIKILNSDIRYIEAAQNYIKINTRHGHHLAYLTMAEVENYLPNEHFSRVHRGYIINNDYVKTVEHGQVILDDKTSIVLGGQYKESFLELMKQMLLQSKRRL
jgi:DNA-binding LytR/AlgR family response regulator